MCVRALGVRKNRVAESEMLPSGGAQQEEEEGGHLRLTSISAPVSMRSIRIFEIMPGSW